MAKTKKFWKWKPRANNSEAAEAGAAERTLAINGIIAEDSWLGDEVTPQEFKDELYAEDGNIILQICSPGGDCFAAAQIYSMLVDYPGKVTVRIDGLAASAASVIAMAGDEVQMYPTSLIMVHNPATVAMGDHNDMKKAIAMLDEVKESIINAYAAKTGLARAKISHLMESESYLNANKAVELGFADTILTREGDTEEAANAVLFSPREVSNAIFSKLTKVCTAADDAKSQQVENIAKDNVPPEPPKDKGAESVNDTTNNSEDGEQEQPASDSDSHIPQGRSVDELMERLSIIQNHI